jgi:hypothetical protein
MHAQNILATRGLGVSQTKEGGDVHQMVIVTGEVPLEDIAWPDPGYADIYVKSYADFGKLRSEGIIGADTRLQVEYPTALGLLSAFFAPEYQRQLLPICQESLFGDLSKLLASVPHEDLAVQWDVGSEFVILGGARPGATSADMTVEGVASRLLPCIDEVPDDIPVGVHLCYGDFMHRHEVEPESLQPQVYVVNALNAKARRDLSWVSFTVPQYQKDPKYFASLASLKLPSDTELYFGIIPYHPSDQAPGTTERQAELIDANLPGAPNREWGISTECGMGRVDRLDVLNLIDTHRELLDLLRR